MNPTSRIKTMLVSLAVLSAFLALSACAGNQIQRGIDPDGDQVSLDNWLEDTLIPYLLQQFGQHPRFKGQPILLVRMHGDNAQSHIDELTDHIREKIVDSLVREPGLDLFWRPATRPWKHHQSLADVSCGDYRKIHYYIGIDCRLTKVEQNLNVKIRALNLAEHKWVSGFGRSWEGKPTPEQLAALKREQPDEYLRGLRPLPFSNQQPDLLAAYLAYNLSCLLRQGEADDLVVHVEDTSANTPAFFQTTLQLVGKYLARFREVAVTDDPNQANVTVMTAILSIQKNMYQIWVSARDRRGKTYLPGAETEAYVMLESQRQGMMADTHKERSHESAPILTQEEKPVALISSFDLITPVDQEVCATDTPWRSGSRRLDVHEHLPTGGCLAVEMRLSAPAYIFLVGQDATGDLTRMFPSDCPDFRTIDAFIHSGKLFQFPPLLDPEARVLELEGAPGMERVYAIAITTPELANRFGYRLDELRGLCQPGKSFPKKLLAGGNWQSHERIHRWQGYLNQLASQYPEKVQWREIRFWHDRPL
ncbi:MAG: DUF4384 domain-containing protein [Desulfobacterales bacterium]